MALWLISGASPAAAERSFEECVAAAIQRSEALTEQDLAIATAKSQESEAHGEMLPNLAATASYLRQQSVQDPTGQRFFPREQPVVKVTLTQPLFRGLRDVAALRRLEHLTKAQEAAKSQALDQLYTDVAQAFFQVLALQSDLRNEDLELRLYDTRIAELKQRTTTGQSAATDALVAEAAQSSVETTRLTTQSQLRAMRDTLAFLTGLPGDVQLKDDGAAPPALPALAELLHGLGGRAEVKAANARLAAADEAVSVARGAHLPSVDLVGNYYLVRPEGPQRDVHWDVEAALTLPLYAGGTLRARVDEAALARDQASLEVSRLTRVADNEVRTAYEAVRADREQLASLGRTQAISERNYRQLKHDYRAGLTRNIDVLQALAAAQESRRLLDHAAYTSRIDMIKLLTAAAARPGRSEGPPHDAL